MTDSQAHWDQTYTDKAATAVSWYQPRLEKSLDLIRKAAPTLSASIIDIGGGASTLPDSLLKAGYVDLTVLDISSKALECTQQRLGPEARRVTWLAADVTKWSPPRKWDVWHDRAVFHFLTTPEDQDQYIAALRAGTYSGSAAIIATFALDGPARCSGLPVQRYSATSLAECLGSPFKMTGEGAERHVTPGGTTQSFTYAIFTRI